MAARWPAHFVVFDLLHFGAEGDLAGRPYAARRAALASLFSEYELRTPWVLCPSTTDSAVGDGWLSWSAVRMEGLVFKRLDQKYAPRPPRAGGSTGHGGRPRRWSVQSAVRSRRRRRCSWGVWTRVVLRSTPVVPWCCPARRPERSVLS
ncbi:hypothetical protein ACFYYH_14975 [Streptomyces sp. NPDC002018]|uniref:ATP-dependent DNA ligase n=1 Tax=Streptomyces sp. NPDC002018 TaxID=3364629 RepID=UPI0036D08968